MLCLNIAKEWEHMSKTKEEEHRLVNNRKDFLTPLQKKILLFLTNNHPSTINEAVKGTNGNYRSSWTAFKELMKKKLIKEVGLKPYRGQEYPRYWSTESGILYSMTEGIKPEILLKKSQEIYPENKILHFLLEILPILGKQNINDMLYMAIVTDGKIPQNDLISIFARQKQLTDFDIKRYNSILKKYPDIYKQHKDFIRQAKKNLKALSDIFDDESEG
jgi:hypothetical protein